MKLKKLAAIAVAAVLLVAGSMAGDPTLAYSGSKNIDDEGTGYLTCLTQEAQARLTPFNLSYTSWCRVTPYATDGSVIYGNEAQKIGSVSVSRVSTKPLSRAIGAYRVVTRTGTVTFSVPAG
ncbi:MAG: hypothetical protein HFI93_03885 [Lachnospiraceae bacterium]|nr:hypothetical protein [Lachnospiraceae bacterium]